MGRSTGIFYNPVEEDEKGPGLGSKVLWGISLLERPAQAYKVGIREASDSDEDGFLAGAKAGWLGEEEVRGQDVLFDREYAKKHPIQAGIGGFLFDVATDPLTYVGGVLFKAVAKGAKLGFSALPAGAQAGAIGAGEAVKQAALSSPKVQGLTRGLNIPMGQARQVKQSSIKQLGHLQQNKNQTDKLIGEYEKWAKKKVKQLGLKGKEGRDQVDTAFRNYIERGGARGEMFDDATDAWENWLKYKDRYVNIGEDGFELARRHAEEYEKILTGLRAEEITLGNVMTQADMFNPVYGYFHHAATPFARRTKGSDIGQLTTNQGITKVRAYKGAADDIHAENYNKRMQQAWDEYLGLKYNAMKESGELPASLKGVNKEEFIKTLSKDLDVDELKNHLGDKIFTRLGEENMFHTNPAIALGVYKRQAGQAMEAKHFRQEMMDPDRNLGLWFTRNPNNPSQVMVRADPFSEWTPATSDQIANYADSGLDTFKVAKEVEIKDALGNVVDVRKGDTEATFMFPKEVAKMVKERHDIMMNTSSKADEFLKYYDDIQNGWKRWTLAIRPAYHTRNMVGNYLNAFMISGVRHAGRYVDAGTLQKKASQGTLDSNESMVGLGTKEKYINATEQELYDAMESRGAIGGQYSTDIQKKAEREFEGLESGRRLKDIITGEVYPVQKAFSAGSHLESNARMGVFLDTVAKASKNPSKYQYYSPTSGYTLSLDRAINSAIKRRDGQNKVLNKYNKQLKRGEHPDGRKLTSQEINNIHIKKKQIEGGVLRAYKRGIKLENQKKGLSSSEMLRALARQEKNDLIYDVAAQEMKKSLFDYTDLSQFERTWMKRLIPFYSWSRKNIPAQLGSLIKNPQRAEKLHIAKEQFEHQGGSPDDRDVGAMWSGTVPVFLGKENEGVRSFFSLLNYAPIADLERLGNPQEILKQMASPILKAPIEQLSNYDFFRERKIKEYEGQKKDFLGVSLPPGAWHAAQLLVPLVELNRLNPGGVFGLKKPGVEEESLDITPGWWGTGASRESGPIDIGGLARTIRFFAGVRTYDLDLQKSRDWNHKKLARDLNTLKGKLKWAKKKGNVRQIEELEALIERVISGEVRDPLLTQ